MFRPRPPTHRSTNSTPPSPTCNTSADSRSIDRHPGSSPYSHLFRTVCHQHLTDKCQSACATGARRRKPRGPEYLRERSLIWSHRQCALVTGRITWPARTNRQGICLPGPTFGPDCDPPIITPALCTKKTPANPREFLCAIVGDQLLPISCFTA